MVRVLTNASAVGRDSPGSSTFFDPRENELLYRATALENELSFSGISLIEDCRKEWWLFGRNDICYHRRRSSANVGVPINSYSSGLQ